MQRNATYPVTGSDIRKARKAAGLTQRRLADLAGLHVNSVKRLERFRRVLRSSFHALERCQAHLPTLSPVGRFLTPWVPAGASFTGFSWQQGQFSDAGKNARPQHGVIEKPAWRPRKADRPRCGAKTRKGSPCQAPARENGRCRMHGGLSTGAKTEAGRQRIREAQHRRWARYRQEKSQGVQHHVL